MTTTTITPRAPLLAVLGLQDEEPAEAGPSTVRTAGGHGATSRPQAAHRTTT